MNSTCGLRFLFVRGNSQVNERKTNDTVYLNINENMNQGKSQEWFKWSTKQQVDYIFKMDSDTAVCPPALLALLESIRGVDYIGYPWPQRAGYLSGKPCSVAQKYCPAHTWYYMSGGFYGMSHRVARIISTAENVVGHEDAVTGYLVHSLLPRHTRHDIMCLNECRFGTENTCEARTCPASHLKFDKQRASKGAYMIPKFCINEHQWKAQSQL